MIPWTENLLTRIFLRQLFRYVICFANFSAYNINLQSFFLPKLNYKYVILLIHLQLLFTLKRICRYLELVFKANIVEAYRNWNRRRIDCEKFGKGFKIRHPLMRWQFLVLSRTTMHPYYAYSAHRHIHEIILEYVSPSIMMTRVPIRMELPRSSCSFRKHGSLSASTILFYPILS